jgi:lysozyme
MAVSIKGVNFVAAWEGFSSRPYNDVAGHCTRGFGELIHYGNCTGRENPVSRERAREWLRQTLNRDYVVAVPKRWFMRQHEKDALASFAYNLGTGAVSDPGFSTLARRLMSDEGRRYRDRKVIYRQELPKWVNAGGKRVWGLVERRAAEVRLAVNGDYSGRP